MTSTVTPFSKLTSSFPWLVYGWIVTYFSSAGVKERGNKIIEKSHTAVDYTIAEGENGQCDPL